MKLVVSGDIDEALTRAVSALVGAERVTPIHARAWRYEGVDDTAAVRAAVAAICDRARVDHAFLDSECRFSQFGLLAMDMDSTLITIECIDEIADLVGKKNEVAAITEAAMRGEITDFAESLRRRVALLAGADASILQRVFDERLKLTSGAETLIAAAKAAGLYTLLVSGGFTYFSDRLVHSLNLDAGYANTLEVLHGKLTGRVIAPIFGSAQKATAVQDILDRRGLPRSAAIVIGDGANDLPMMNLVEHSIAFHGKPAVVDAARHAVRHGSLETVVDYFS